MSMTVLCLSLRYGNVLALSGRPVSALRRLLFPARGSPLRPRARLPGRPRRSSPRALRARADLFRSSGRRGLRSLQARGG
jgi:hypothetical protein